MKFIVIIRCVQDKIFFILSLFRFMMFLLKPVCLSLFLFCCGCIYADIKPTVVLQKWEDCQLRSNLNANCVEINRKAIAIKELLQSWEINRQHFGIDIMELQQRVSSLSDSDQGKQNLQQELEMRLAIVGWLESPK